jgi:hypothetical protein
MRNKKVKELLRAIEDQVEEIQLNSSYKSLSAEECLAFAFEQVLVNSPEKQSQAYLATVNRDKVLFCVGEDRFVELYEGGFDNDEDSI